MKEPFYAFRAQGEEPANAELLIFSVIGDWEELGEVSAKAFAADLAKLPSTVKRLDIHINSPGGSVAEANGIYSRLADHRSQKIVYIDGLAASAASIVACVGHKIYIRENANVMVHLPSAIAMGNAEDMRTVAAALDSVTESMINIYARRTKLDREKLRSLMAAETWFSPQQAVEHGFADELRGVVKAAAVVGTKRVIVNGIEHDLSRFHNVPAFTAAITNVEGKPTMSTPAKPTAAADDPPKEKEGTGNGDEGKEKETPTPPTPPAAPSKPSEVPEPPKTAANAEFERGVQAERSRVTALQALDRPATHDIVQAAIKDGKTVADIAGSCMAAMDKVQTQGARRTDAHALDGIPGSDAGTGNGDGNAAAFGAKIKEKVQARMKQRRSAGAFSRN